MIEINLFLALFWESIASQNQPGSTVDHSWRSCSGPKLLRCVWCWTKPMPTFVARQFCCALRKIGNGCPVHRPKARRAFASVRPWLKSLEGSFASQLYHRTAPIRGWARDPRGLRVSYVVVWVWIPPWFPRILSTIPSVGLAFCTC